MNAMAAQAMTASTEFRSLVCLFLYGGNDANNMIVPRDNTNYASYAAARGPLALAQNTLVADQSHHARSARPLVRIASEHAGNSNVV